MKLSLKAKTNNWEFFKKRKENPIFKKARAMILQRDHCTCQFCKFESQHLEIVNADNDYQNNKKSNLVCACALCAKCTLLDAYSLDYVGSDKIIYLPELTQEQLNHLVRALFCKIYSNNQDSVYNAKKLLAQLQDRAKWLDERTGSHLSHPGLFVHYLNSKDVDIKLVAKLKWLPDLDGFREYIDDWKEQLAVV